MTIYCINLFLRERVIFSELENSKKMFSHQMEKVLLENSLRFHVHEVENSKFLIEATIISYPRSGKSLITKLHQKVENV